MLRWRLIVLLVITAGIAWSSPHVLQARPGVATVGNCPIFPPDNPWNRDISNDPVDPNSDMYIATLNSGNNTILRAGFGLWRQYGLPYVIVPGTQPKVPITFTDWGAQSDPGPYPIPPDAPVEGAGLVESDQHVIVLDQDNCLLYELYNASYNGVGWNASSGAIFNLRSNQLRPEGWTSADAAGLPIFPGLIRYAEVQTGAITHALRFTVGSGMSGNKYIYPAGHFQNDLTAPNLVPMGLRVRLKASFDISGYAGPAKIILQALKKYGMFVADEGNPWYVSGTADPRWDRASLETLTGVPGSAFEVVRADYSNLVTPTPGGTQTDSAQANR